MFSQYYSVSWEKTMYMFYYNLYDCVPDKTEN